MTPRPRPVAVGRGPRSAFPAAGSRSAAERCAGSPRTAWSAPSHREGVAELSLLQSVPEVVPHMTPTAGSGPPPSGVGSSLMIPSLCTYIWIANVRTLTRTARNREADPAPASRQRPLEPDGARDDHARAPQGPHRRRRQRRRQRRRARAAAPGRRGRRTVNRRRRTTTSRCDPGRRRPGARRGECPAAAFRHAEGGSPGSATAWRA